MHHIPIRPKSKSEEEISRNAMIFLMNCVANLIICLFPNLTLQPVGFVTFSSRATAEAAKQDLQVRTISIIHDAYSTSAVT